LKENDEKPNGTRVGLKDVLAFVDMAMEEHPGASAPVSAHQIFEELTALIDQTLRGTKIKRFSPGEGSRLFHRFEIHSDGGDVLACLNMIYLRKPMAGCYLVYVEVLPTVRGKGLGSRILKAFAEFVESSKAIGLLDNIILPEEPTHTLYAGLGWRPLEELIGCDRAGEGGHYMIYVPESVRVPDLKEKVTKLFFKVRKKKAIVERQDNEEMVRRTIKEFGSVYETLHRLFEKELASGGSTPFMCFMFTKFVRKALGFRRRIAGLLGYTGGALDWISISDRIKGLPILPYSLWSPLERKVEIWEEAAVRNLPGRLLQEPTFFIEDLPFYRRPYLSPWIEKRGAAQPLQMRISDLLELGFDPTRLREFRHEGTDYIFERLSPGLLPSMVKLGNLLKKVSEPISGIRFHHAAVSVNPPLAIFRDRGNGYILRKRVEGIHFDEALDQLRSSSHLKGMNETLGIDRVLIATVNEVNKWLLKTVSPGGNQDLENLTFFVSWDIERNMPGVAADPSGVSFNVIWIA